MDAVDEGMIERDPTRKAIIKGKTPGAKKIKYLNQFELHTLIAHLDIKEKVNWDWFILLVAKTGCDFLRRLPLHRQILILQDRPFPLVKHGITKEMADSFQRKQILCTKNSD